MKRVKIRTNNSRDPERKRKLLEHLSKNYIYVNMIFVASEGFTVYTNTDGDLDRLFNEITDKYLENKGFTSIIPPRSE